MQMYMSQWDGQAFFVRMHLTNDKTVLEIGVGTGRLALKAAPLCRHLTGIDFSPKTIERAKTNLDGMSNITLICDDYMDYSFNEQYDIIYSSLTFMHFEDKQRAITKASTLLKEDGRLVISIDKNQSDCIDMGNRKITVFPDQKNVIRDCMTKADLDVKDIVETEFAYILEAVK